MAQVVVIGGGISGLAAAWELAGDREHDVLVLESSPAVGGKLRLDSIAGQQVDVGAESMLARRPEAVDLLAQLGIRAEHPSTGGARLWSRGRLVPLPTGTVMGVPASAQDAAGVLNPEEIRRAAAETQIDVADDISVGDLVEQALGPAVVDRLVEPLLGGVYAGHARLLSAQACVPALFAAAQQGRPLTQVASAAAARATDATRSRAAGTQPVFAGLAGGVGRLPQVLREQLHRRGATIRCGTTVRRIEPGPAGWRLVTGPAPAPVAIDADAVILATPAHPTARLLADHAPYAASLLDRVDYASMAIVTMAFSRAEMPVIPTGSGFLVPPVDGHAIKASTFSTGKWPWLATAAPDTFLLRVSLGRHGEEAVLQRDDAELVEVGVRELSTALGTALPRPVDARVQRWGGALPQYAVGHRDRVEATLRAVEPLRGLELAGAAYDGVGIPACIGSGRAAAARARTHLQTAPTPDRQ